jgi:hypothetical protein
VIGIVDIQRTVRSEARAAERAELRLFRGAIGKRHSGLPRSAGDDDWHARRFIDAQDLVATPHDAGAPHLSTS